MPSEHSIISPSAADRWIYCPGSIKLSQELGGGEYKSSIYAAEGSMMHSMAEETLKTSISPFTQLGKIKKVDGFDISVTEEHVNVVTYYLNIVQLLKDEYPNGKVSIEERVHLDYAPYPHIKGTIDLCIDDYMNCLVVCDLKTGQGISVDADSNQIKLYAIMKAGSELMMYPKIKLVIVQPRDRGGERFKYIDLTPEELLAYKNEIIIPAIEDCISDNPSFHPGEKQCRWCECSGRCTYQAKEALSIAANEFDDWSDVTLPEVQLLTNEDLAKILKLFPLINSFQSSVVDIATQELQHGREVPGYKLVEGRSLRQWKEDEKKTVEFLKKLRLTMAQIYAKKLNSPAAIEKLPKAKGKIAEQVIKPKGKPTIAPVEDKREAIDPKNKASNDFAEDLFS